MELSTKQKNELRELLKTLEELMKEGDFYTSAIEFDPYNMTIDAGELEIDLKNHIINLKNLLK